MSQSAGSGVALEAGDRQRSGLSVSAWGAPTGVRHCRKRSSRGEMEVEVLEEGCSEMLHKEEVPRIKLGGAEAKTSRVRCTEVEDGARHEVHTRTHLPRSQLIIDYL